MYLIPNKMCILFVRAPQPFKALSGVLLDFLPEAVELSLVCTEFLRAVPAVQIAVCHRREPFRMQVKCDLPAEHQDEGHGQQGP